MYTKKIYETISHVSNLNQKNYLYSNIFTMFFFYTSLKNLPCIIEFAQHNNAKKFSITCVNISHCLTIELEYVQHIFLNIIPNAVYGKQIDNDSDIF